ncbi:hypothetical protein EMCRGX_G019483 [Ephydatia muelleri]
MSATKKRKVMILEDRINALKKIDKGKSRRAVSSKLGVGKTQIQVIVKERDVTQRRWKSGERSDKKYVKPRMAGYDDLDKLVWEWFTIARLRTYLYGTYLTRTKQASSTELCLPSQCQSKVKMPKEDDTAAIDSTLSAFVKASGASWKMYANFDQDLATNETIDEDWDAALLEKARSGTSQLIVVHTQSLMKIAMRKKWSLKSLPYLLY